jgi:inorganic pyrophosphatase
MNLWKELKPWDFDTNGANITTLRVVVEIPKGSLIKYELSPDGSVLTAVREMNRKYRYIYNYGFIPGTLGGDNDPLDAIIIYDEPIKAGTVLNCKILGIIRTIDKGEQDDKILVYPYFSNLKTGKLKKELKKIVRYLNNYKYPFQEGTYITKLEDGEKAFEAINLAISNFEGGIK